MGLNIDYRFDKTEYQRILDFYLDILSPQIELTDKFLLDLIEPSMFRKYKQYSGYFSLDNFIDFCVKNTRKDVITKLFNNTDKLKVFIKDLVNLLLHFDPRKRASLIDIRLYLLKFFIPPPPTVIPSPKKLSQIIFSDSSDSA